jgi:dephospho-CoA kinase
MLKLRKVAITGGLSCGKSSVCRILKEFGAYVVSADAIVHQLMSSDTNLGQEIVNLLGPSILVNQKIDRSRIARIVFHDLELLEALETLVHPAVYKELNKDYQRQQNQPQPPSLFVAEIPLLFESGGQRDYDDTVAVVANVEICCQRFMKATGLDQTEFNHRMDRQLPLLDKALLADYVIMNNGTLSDLQQITKELYQELIIETENKL